MTTSGKIDTFNKSVTSCANTFVDGWYFVSQDYINTYGCNNCRHICDFFGGTPHDGNNTIFKTITDNMNDKTVINMSTTPKTRLIYLRKGSGFMHKMMLYGFTVDICHLDKIAKIDPQHEIRNKFFSGQPITINDVDILKNKMTNWFNLNSANLRLICLQLRSDIVKAIANVLNDTYHVMLLPTIDFMNWLSLNTMKASSIIKLIKIEMSSNDNENVELFKVKFDPTTNGLNKEEMKIVRTYSNGEFVLKWNASVDFDLHVTIPLADGNIIHICYRNKEYPGIKLDHDNTSGGPSSQEVITFDPKTLIEAGITKLNVHILLFSNFKGVDNIPFEVTIKQNGHTTSFNGMWISNKPGCNKTGNCIENSCLSHTIELKIPNKKTNVFDRHQLPSGFSIIDDEKLNLTPITPVTFEAGRGTKLYALMKTPYHFRNTVTPLLVGGKNGDYQLSNDTECGYAFIFNNVNYYPVGKFPLSKLPLDITFSKEVFPFGREGLEVAEKYRGKVYSPYKSWEIDSILGKLEIPDVISRLIMSYYTEEQFITLFTVVSNSNTNQSTNWWSILM